MGAARRGRCRGVRILHTIRFHEDRYERERSIGARITVTLSSSSRRVRRRRHRLCQGRRSHRQRPRVARVPVHRAPGTVGAGSPARRPRGRGERRARPGAGRPTICSPRSMSPVSFGGRWTGCSRARLPRLRRCPAGRSAARRGTLSAVVATARDKAACRRAMSAAGLLSVRFAVARTEAEALAAAAAVGYLLIVKPVAASPRA